MGAALFTAPGWTRRGNQLSGNLGVAQVLCTDGFYGYVGYLTAWMMDQLQGDSFAHGAFVQGSGEIFTETKNWEFVESNIPSAKHAAAMTASAAAWTAVSHLAA